ncbi:MAG TPA: ribonuclease III [Alphaproteobacteria bacterium]
MDIPFDHPLIQQALTHSSALAASGAAKRDSYERLEFLGDRVLGFFISGLLYTQFPDETEGDLAKRFSALVSQPVLAGIAMELGLEERLHIAAKERFAHDGKPSASVLSDAVEALIAALYLIGGLELAGDFVREYWEPLLHQNATPPQEAKTSLQEWAQARALPLPAYKLVERSGPDHRPEFIVSVTVTGYEPVMGQGASKQAAEKVAAEKLLHILQQRLS